MKRNTATILFLIYLLSFTTTVLSQNVKIDSLKNELQNHKEKDVTRVDLLYELALEYCTKDIETALTFNKEAEEISDALNYIKGKAHYTYIKGFTQEIQSDFDKALQYYNESLQLYKIIDFKKGTARSYIGIGVIYYYMSDYENSILFYKKSIALNKVTNDINGIGSGLNNIGIVYEAMGDYEKAITYYNEAVEKYNDVNDLGGVASSLNNLAVVYDYQGNYIFALQYYNKTLLVFREDNSKEAIASTIYNIGAVYRAMEQHMKALPYFEESLALNKELNNNQSIAQNLIGLGTIYVYLNKYDKALRYFNEALIINESIDSKLGIIDCHNQIGGVYLDLEQPTLALINFKSCLRLSLDIGNMRSICYSHISLAQAHFMLQNYSEALNHGKEGKIIADDLEVLKEQKSVNVILSKIYEKTGNYKKSLNHFQLYKSQNDSLFNKKNIDKIAQVQYEYKYKQQLDSANIRELKLAKTVKDTSQDLQKSQRNYLWAIISILLVSMLLGGIIFFLKFRNIKSKTKNIVIEQKLLRSQMTPHFIFNSLSVLQGMILNKEEKKSVSYLSKFSKLLRIILENSRDKTVSLSQELAAVENYLALQNLENESYIYSIYVEQTIDVPSFEIPPMLIQPFVENAIEHAFGNHTDNRQVDVHLKYSDKKMICTISDNGCGINSQKASKRKDKNSLATTITSERLQILSKDFKMEGSVTIQDRQKYKEQGTIVTIVIPYKIMAA